MSETSHNPGDFPSAEVVNASYLSLYDNMGGYNMLDPERKAQLDSDNEVIHGVGVRMRQYYEFSSEILGIKSESSGTEAVIEDIGLYTAFIKEKYTTAPEDQVYALDLPVDIVSTMRDTVSRCYGYVRSRAQDLDEEQIASFEEVAENTLRDFAGIMAAYEEVGLDRAELYEGADNSYKAMEAYVKHWGRDDLSGFLAAEERLLLTPPEQYDERGPGVWHKNDMRSNWDPAIQLVRELRDEGHETLADEIRENLILAIDAVIYDIGENPDPLARLEGEYDQKNLANIRRLLLRDIDFIDPGFDRDLFEKYTEPTSQRRGGEEDDLLSA